MTTGSESLGSMKDGNYRPKLLSVSKEMYFAFPWVLVAYCMFTNMCVAGLNKASFLPQPVYVLQAWPVGTESLI
jgi:hypothetical protein